MRIKMNKEKKIGVVYHVSPLPPFECIVRYFVINVPKDISVGRLKELLYDKYHIGDFGFYWGNHHLDFDYSKFPHEIKEAFEHFLENPYLYKDKIIDFEKDLALFCYDDIRDKIYVVYYVYHDYLYDIKRKDPVFYLINDDDSNEDEIEEILEEYLDYCEERKYIYSYRETAKLRYKQLSYSDNELVSKFAKSPKILLSKLKENMHLPPEKLEEEMSFEKLLK